MEQPSQISYPFNGHPAPGATREVASGVRWVRMPLKFSLDHINLWMLDEGDGWTVVDTGLAVDDIKRHWEEILAARCTRKPVKRIIATHCHPDHLGLAGWLERKTGAPVWVTAGELLTGYAWFQQLPNYDFAGMVEFFRRHGLDRARGEALASDDLSYKEQVDLLPTSYHRMIGGDTIHIGNHDWRVIVGYGHSPEHASLHCAELGILISGDMLLPRISTNVSTYSFNPDGNPLKLFLDSIERYAELPPDTLVLPSHGRPFRGAHARVAQLQAHHRGRLNALTAACDTPKTACELIPTLFQRELDEHTLLAMGESIAHLNYLEHAGEVLRAEDANGVIRFVNRPERKE